MSQPDSRLSEIYEQSYPPSLWDGGGQPPSGSVRNVTGDGVFWGNGTYAYAQNPVPTSVDRLSDIPNGTPVTLTIAGVAYGRYTFTLDPTGSLWNQPGTLCWGNLGGTDYLTPANVNLDGVDHGAAFQGIADQVTVRAIAVSTTGPV